MRLAEHQRKAPRAVALRLALACLAASPAAARAHELGVIQVSAVFERDGTYRVDVAIDEERGPMVAAGVGAEPTPRERALKLPVPADLSQVVPFLQLIAGRSTLAFDGRPAVPETLAVDRPPAPANDPFAPLPRLTLHLKGAVPAGARRAVWTVAIPLGSFPLAFANAGDASPSRQWVIGGRPSRPFALSAEVVPPGRWPTARRYLGLGFRRILPQGAEPILFVLGILLLSLRLRPLLAQVAAFTVAHLAALALATYGLISLSPRLIAPAVALSIVYVAIGNVLAREPGPWRLALVFGCGLLHGLSFASALREAGPPRSERATALLSFAAGLEAGQLAVLAATLLLVGLPFRDQPWYRQRVVVPASLALAAIGLYWSIQRLGT